MKNKLNRLGILMWVLMPLLFATSCDKCKDPDPCKNATEVSADFTMTEVLELPYVKRFGDYFVPFDTDTVGRGSVLFTALEENAKYTWTIGAETLHTQTVTRSGFPAHEEIPITLVVEKTPNGLCYPDDDGVDTLTRNLYQAGSHIDSLFLDDFQGYLEGNPQDTFTVSFWRKEIPQSATNLWARNLKRGCEAILSKSLFGFKQMAFDGVTLQCDHPKGQAMLSPDFNEITITYHFKYGENTGETYVFKGVRK